MVKKMSDSKLEEPNDDLLPEYNFDYGKPKPNRFAPKDSQLATSDLQKYIKERAAYDAEFTRDFEEGFADFKLGGPFQQAKQEGDLYEG